MGIEQPSGQEIKNELEGEQAEITHGRLYPNLDTLVDKGYLDKGMLDRRTNFYSPSEKGKQMIRERYEWEHKYVDFE